MNQSRQRSAGPKGKTKETELMRELKSTGIKQIGNYRLGHTIGEGTYGKVKLALHLLIGQEVAIKVVDKIHAPIVIREIETWRRLRHPYIAQLYEVLTSESKIFMVTEFAPGGELFDYITREGALSESEAKRMFRQLLLAMQYCHERRFVHRDLKLENILLTANLDVKVIDFGFTREYESKAKLLETYCGSTAYAAPEMIMGQRYSGPEADIWSLGVILYTIVCGYLPFDDDNETRVHSKIMSASYELPDTLSPNLMDLIQRILRVQPNERISIEQMLKHEWLKDVVVDVELVSPTSFQLKADSGTKTKTGLYIDTNHLSSAQDKSSTPASTRQTKLTKEKVTFTDVLEVLSLEEKLVLHQLTILGFDTRTILQSIAEDTCDSSSTLFYLVLKRLKSKQVPGPLASFADFSMDGSPVFPTIDGSPVGGSPTHTLEAPTMTGGSPDIYVSWVTGTSRGDAAALRDSLSRDPAFPLLSSETQSPVLQTAPASALSSYGIGDDGPSALFAEASPASFLSKASPIQSKTNSAAPAVPLSSVSSFRGRRKKQQASISEEEEEKEKKDQTNEQAESEEVPTAPQPLETSSKTLEPANEDIALAKTNKQFGRSYRHSYQKSADLNIDQLNHTIRSQDTAQPAPTNRNQIQPSFDDIKTTNEVPEIPLPIIIADDDQPTVIEDIKATSAGAIRSASSLQSDPSNANVSTENEMTPFRRLYHSGAHLGLKLKNMSLPWDRLSGDSRQNSNMSLPDDSENRTLEEAAFNAFLDPFTNMASLIKRRLSAGNTAQPPSSNEPQPQQSSVNSSSEIFKSIPARITIFSSPFKASSTESSPKPSKEGLTDTPNKSYSAS